MIPSANCKCNNESVYELLTSLCDKTASKYSNPRLSQKVISSKMRSLSYEIILKKSTSKMSLNNIDPFIDLSSLYFILHNTAKNVSEYKRSAELKNLMDVLRKTDFGDTKDLINDVLRLLNGLRYSEKQDLSVELFQNPFSFGLLDQMLPKPKKETFGSCQPYSYYPSHIFELPYTLKRKGSLLNKQEPHCYKEYTVDSFDSKSYFYGNSQNGSEVKTFLTPMSLESLTSSNVLPYSENIMLNCPRLTEPRDLRFPSSLSSNANGKVSLTSTDVKEVYRAEVNDSIDVWDMVTKLDEDVPDDVWDYVSKLPEVKERQTIASSSREMALWRRTYSGQLAELCVVSEKIFIRHIMYLIIGIETSSFPFSNESNCFYMKDNLVLEGVSKEYLRGYVVPLVVVGTYYKRLYNFAFSTHVEDNFQSKGLIYEAAREVIRRYLLEFRLAATEMYEDCDNRAADNGCMPTLLQILHHLEPLKYQIETIVTIYKLSGADSTSGMPRGAELMSYLFGEMSLVTHRSTALALYNSMFYICKVYFNFIERFIFEGELDDPYNEFFIRKDNQYVNSRSKRYWDKGFHIVTSVAIPEFLRPLASFILLCGKSLRLLKLCNPGDPLIVLLSSGHPAVRACSSWARLAHARRVLDVYRTRCLFVAGERASLQRLLLRRDAERKAFAELASLKQAETMEKIVAERKRLAQLIVAEKQHSLKVLEAAMAEAKAAKNKAKQRERKLYELEVAAVAATEEVDSKLKENESNKIMEYYSKLNMEVERSKIHTEWKIKRLQLDESRMQLLSTEERNLKREKLEMEHQRNEDVMAMSIQSLDLKSDDELEDNKSQGDRTDDVASNVDVSNENYKITQETLQINNNKKTYEINQPQTNAEKYRARSQSSNDVFSAICNVAKSIFGVGKDVDECDNEIKIDAEGNIVNTQPESKVTFSAASKVVNENKIEDSKMHLQYLQRKKEALQNKQKVMEHELIQTDQENNEMKVDAALLLTKSSSVDEENNLDNKWCPFVEAKKNKLKVLSAELNVVNDELKQDIIIEPRNIAHKEALLNRKKILGVEYNLPVENVITKEPANIAQQEAILNRKRVLGVEYNLPEESYMSKEPANDAQVEALFNKKKILGVEYNLPKEYKVREPVNAAQEEAIRIKNKVLGSDYDLDTKKRFDSTKKSNLRLNLTPCNERSDKNICVTSNDLAVTPGELMTGAMQLDLETPTTADMPLESAITGDAFTPKSETNKEFEPTKSNKEYLTSDGFNFSIIVDEETIDSGINDNIPTEVTPDNSPAKKQNIKCTHKSVFNILDGSYSLDNFDPFGIKQLHKYDKDYFNNKINEDMKGSFYTHPSVIMENVKKRPYNNIFASRFASDDDDERITCDNIVTLTACLQRSVMQPLTYQLEVVNNSILNYFLVNLDMYEHMKSLKDYFFLMDGEFSRSICHNLFSKLTKTLNPQELLNFATLHNILDKALGASILNIHKFSENLSFTISDPPLSFQHSSPDVLQSLSLSYSVGWPLNIILSQEALVRYAKVFQFLIKMRRISWVLSEGFENLKLSVKLLKPNSRKLLRSPQYISIQIYRHIMSSLMRALDNYIVTTCIVTSWTEFETDLKKARTLDDLYECHVVYIKKVLFRCLLNNRSTPVMKLLNDMFTVILKFSRVLKAGEWQQKDPNGCYLHTNFAQLEELFHLFEKLAKYLHKVVTKLMECGYQRHLVELLTMVNLNGYYSERSKEDANVSIQST